MLWLSPDPAGPFTRLTTDVCAAFPDYPPYGGAFTEIIPHLTVADQLTDDLEQLRLIEQTLRLLLPLITRIDRVLLIAGAEAASSWRVLHEIALTDPAVSTAEG